MDRIERLKKERTEKYHPNGVLIRKKPAKKVFGNAEFHNNNQTLIFKPIVSGNDKNYHYDICMVGNGPSVLKTKMGTEIDKHSVVIRFNIFDILPEYTGTKCNVWVLNGKCLQAQGNKFQEVLRTAREYKKKYGDIDTVLIKVSKRGSQDKIRELFEIFPNLKIDSVFLNSEVKPTLNKLVGTMTKPTTGIYTIIWSKLKYKQIPLLYGFDMINGQGGHYNKDKYLNAHPIEEEQTALRKLLKDKEISLFNFGDLKTIKDYLRASKNIVVNKSNAEKNNLESKYIPKSNKVFRYDKNKSVAVVGNSVSLLDSGLGEEIDKHDIVIRFNFGPTKGFEKDVGSKTDLRILGKTHIFREFENEMLIHRYNKEEYRSIDKRENYEKEYPRLTAFTNEYFNYINDTFFNGLISSSGFMGVAMAIKMSDNVSVFGFQNTEEKQHYFPDPEIAKGTVHNISARHQVNKERGLLLQFLKENYIKIWMGK